MIRPVGIFAIALSISLFLPSFAAPELWAFTASEKQTFHHGPFAFRIEMTVKGNGSLKKQNPIPITSLKVKMKNERASSESLKVKTIRVYFVPNVFRDVATREFTVTPGQWVTKYFHLRKDLQPLLGERGYIEVAFENFVIQFYPRERKFSGPV
jgi:hypothetical protein